jgi:hypothetical protein
MTAFFLIDMHQNLEKPPESLGIEMEPDDNDTSDFQQRYTVCSGVMCLLYRKLGISARNRERTDDKRYQRILE